MTPRLSRALTPVIAVLSAAGTIRGQPVVYVDINATLSPHDGSSWCHAYTDLQAALDAATAVTDIRVADGVYRPDRDTGDRAATFQLTSGIAIYGGYAGCGAPDPDERDLRVYETVLSGDLNGDDVPGGGAPDSDCCAAHETPGCEDAACEAAVCAHLADCCNDDWAVHCALEAMARCCLLCSDQNNCENSYHVVNATDADATAVLDGLTITAGNARGMDGSTAPTSFGGGLHVIGGGPTVNRCTFENNEARWGGGLANDSGNPIVINSVFIGNSADVGGAMSNFSGAPVLINGMFSGNRASIDGGAVFNDLSSPTMTNCTLAGNSAFVAAGIRNYAAVELTLTNCILWGNTAETGVGEDAQIISTSSGVTVNHSCIEGWTGAFGGVGNFGLDPRFVDADGPDETYGTRDDDQHLQNNSPCIDAGDNTVVTISTDLDGQPRIVNDIVDVGADEFQGAGIPAASEWGLVVTFLLLLTGGTVLVRRPGLTSPNA